MTNPLSSALSAAQNHVPGNAIQLARTLLAVSLLITLTFTAPTALFRLLVDANEVIECQRYLAIGAYCIFPSVIAANVVGIIIQLWVISGFLPRWSGLPQAWFAMSFDWSVSLGEGGDQVNHNLSLLLAIIALFDNRLNGWSKHVPFAQLLADRSHAVRSTCRFALLLAILQVCFIYAHSGLGKIRVQEWSEGSAVYYTMNGQFGIPRYLDPLGELLTFPLVAIAATWSVILLEVALALSPLFAVRARRLTILAGALFHVGIIVFMGLWSFGIAMFAALLILSMRLRNTPFETIWRSSSSTEETAPRVTSSSAL